MNKKKEKEKAQSTAIIILIGNIYCKICKTRTHLFKLF